MSKSAAFFVFLRMVPDANAAVIPRLKIDDLRKRALEERDVAETLSDEKAQFAFALDPGIMLRFSARKDSKHVPSCSNSATRGGAAFESR